MIRMEDMLSMPYSLLVSLATSSSNNSSRIFSLFFFYSSLLLTHLTISSLLFYSQIPSHPIIMNSTPSFFTLVISGSAVMICSSGGNFGFYLYYKSPNARDKFKLPLTLPYWTSPPARLIL